MNNTMVSIIMPTLNSSRTLEKVLVSIRNQDYSGKLEILLLDGGSNDMTLEIATKYNCRILHNSQVQQEYAKFLGMQEAQGKYVIFLDSDEELSQNDDISLKSKILSENPESMIVISSGYINPEGESTVNDYINNFSDPFAYFMYGLSSDAKSYCTDLKAKYNVVRENKEMVLINFTSNKPLPLADMAAGTMLDLERFKKIFSNDMKNADVVPKIFYLATQETQHTAMIKDHGIRHYSAETFKKYLRKLRWRVVVNIHYQHIPGTGFSNRLDFYPSSFKLKRYLFPLWGLTLVGPFIVSLLKYVHTKKPVVFMHAPLTFYTAIYICWQYGLALLGVHPTLRSYGGGEKKIEVASKVN